MKRTRLKKQSKQPISKLQRKLWEVCRKIALIRAQNRSGHVFCFTCDSGPLSGSNMQLGHFIPKSVCGAYLKYDLRNLRFQCMRCNIHGGGMGAEFYRRLVETEGKAYVDQLFQDKNKIVKAYDHFLSTLIQYESILNSNNTMI